MANVSRQQHSAVVQRCGGGGRAGGGGLREVVLASKMFLACLMKIAIAERMADDCFG